MYGYVVSVEIYLHPYPTVSGYVGYRKHANDFTLRVEHLRKVVTLLTDTFITPVISSTNDVTEQKYGTKDQRPILRFDPPIPRVSLIHVYFCCSVDVAKEALVM